MTLKELVKTIVLAAEIRMNKLSLDIKANYF